MAGNNPNANTHIYGTTSRPVDSPENEYPYQPNVEISDNFLEFDDWLEEDNAPFLVSSGYPDQNPVYASYEAGNATGSSTNLQGANTRDNDIETSTMGVKERVAFKMKSEVEILDDGFKWRKYGKKMVKQSPNPRNYYKCSVEGCSVKKRVERDANDPTYVITTYDGVHNHEESIGPCSELVSDYGRVSSGCSACVCARREAPRYLL